MSPSEMTFGPSRRRASWPLLTLVGEGLCAIPPPLKNHAGRPQRARPEGSLRCVTDPGGAPTKDQHGRGRSGWRTQRRPPDWLIPLLLCLTLLGCGHAPRKAELIVGVENGPTSLDPRVGSDLASDRVFQLLYRGLFRAGPRLETLPDLVDAWEQPSETRYRFRLLAGIRFSDGRELTSADAAFTLESIRTGAVRSFRKGDLGRIARIGTPDPRTLEVDLREPFSAFPSVLTMGIVPAGTAPDAVAPPGAGPFRLRALVPGQWVLFEANPHHAPPPGCRTVAFKVIPDGVVRALEMRRGSVDLVVNDMAPDSLDYFRREGFRVLRTPGSNYRYIGFNLSRPMLSDPSVRRALAYAIDRAAILHYIQRGFGRPADSLLCPENWAHAAGLPIFSHDPRASERLLDEAGYPRGDGGRRGRLTFKTSTDKVSRQIAVAVQEDLARVGVALEIRSLEWGIFYADIRNGDFDLFGLTWVGLSDPDAFRLRFSSAQMPPLGLNRGRYASAEVDSLVEAGAREADPLRRKEIYGRIQAILAVELPYIPLWYPDNVAVFRGGLQGVAVPPDGNFSFLAGVRRKT